MPRSSRWSTTPDGSWPTPSIRAAVYIYSVRSAAGFKKLSEVSATDLANNVTELTRLGDTLYGLAGKAVVPISIWDDASDVPNGLMVGASFSIGAAGLHILGAGDTLYVTLASGELQTWLVASGTPTKVGSLSLGGDVRSLQAKGSKVIAAVHGQGLAVVDVGDPTAPQQIALDTSMTDIASAKLFGRTLVATLDRGTVAAVDVSDWSAPRVVTATPGVSPTYVNVTNGTLVFGSGKSATVANVPPTITAAVPQPIVHDYPLQAQIPVTFSKPVDPASATTTTVTLTCGGTAVSGQVLVAPDWMSLTFLADALLPEGASCTLDASGVADLTGAQVAGTAKVSLTTASAPTEPVSVPGSTLQHTPDGTFTGFVPDAGTYKGEWSDVTPVKGTYTNFYADFEDNKLNLLNDWYFNSDKVDPDCYNEFNAWTGNGAEQWTIRAYGDKHVTVLKNGTALDPGDGGVLGGSSYGPSPKVAEPHTIYELQIAASPGSWGVKLCDPGPDVPLQPARDPFNADPWGARHRGHQGDDDRHDPTPQCSYGHDAPLAGQRRRHRDGNALADLGWIRAASTLSTFQLQLSTSSSFKYLGWNIATAGSSYTAPNGVLAPNTTYYWRVLTLNAAGQAVSATGSFSTAAAVTYTLTTTMTGSGTITSGEDAGPAIDCGSVCSASYASGSVATLTAVATRGISVQRLVRRVLGMGATTTVTLNADKTCTATFAAMTTTYQVSVSAGGDGSGSIASLPTGISCGDDAGVCSADFASGVSVQLTATPDGSSQFSGWSGDCSGTANPYTLTVDSNKSCVAAFEPVHIAKDSGAAGAGGATAQARRRPGWAAHPQRQPPPRGRRERAEQARQIPPNMSLPSTPKAMAVERSFRHRAASTTRPRGGTQGSGSSHLENPFSSQPCPRRAPSSMAGGRQPMRRATPAALAPRIRARWSSMGT